MCLATSNNLLLVLQDAPKCIFSANSQSSGQPKNDAKTLFFTPPIPFPWYFLQLQQYWHLQCFAILGSTSTVIHNVKQHLLRNQPGSGLRPLATSYAKDYKAHSLQQTSFAESPNTLLLTEGKIQLPKALIWHSSLSTWNNNCNTL